MVSGTPWRDGDNRWYDSQLKALNSRVGTNNWLRRKVVRLNVQKNVRRKEKKKKSNVPNLLALVKGKIIYRNKRIEPITLGENPRRYNEYHHLTSATSIERRHKSMILILYILTPKEVDTPPKSVRTLSWQHGCHLCQKKSRQRLLGRGLNSAIRTLKFSEPCSRLYWTNFSSALKWWQWAFKSFYFSQNRLTVDIGRRLLCQLTVLLRLIVIPSCVQRLSPAMLHRNSSALVCSRLAALRLQERGISSVWS